MDKLEGGEKKMQISGEPMPIFFLLFNVQSQAPPTLLLVLLSQGMYYVKVTKTCTLTLFLRSQFTLNIYTCVNSILKWSVSMKQISLGADTEATISILTGSNFDQYCTD